MLRKIVTVITKSRSNTIRQCLPAVVLFIFFADFDLTVVRWNISKIFVFVNIFNIVLMHLASTHSASYLLKSVIKFSC